MLKKAIFDMDGLIFDSERVFMSCLKDVAKRYGYIITEEIYAPTLGLNAAGAALCMKKAFGEDYPFDEISAAARARMARLCEKGLPVKKGIVSLLELLKSNNIICAVASSTHTEFVRRYLKSAGLYGYFSEITGGDAVAASKPAPDIFLKALGNEQRENAVIFEDSENGVRAALNAGIRVICIPDMRRPPQSVLDNVFACVNDADEAARLIQTLLRGTEPAVNGGRV